MTKSNEYRTFDKAMSTILRADPNAVKSAVDAEIQANTAEREARGEHKRGRKPKRKRATSALDRASGAKD
jgi:hypothetical protein